MLRPGEDRITAAIAGDNARDKAGTTVCLRLRPSWVILS